MTADAFLSEYPNPWFHLSSFGIHNGRSLADIWIREPDYVHWIVSQIATGEWVPRGPVKPFCDALCTLYLLSDAQVRQILLITGHLAITRKRKRGSRV
jgi:hypothetical protein